MRGPSSACSHATHRDPLDDLRALLCQLLAHAELDVLVNNEGRSLDAGARVTETDVEALRRTYETNVFGVVAMTNAFLPALRRSARPRIAWWVSVRGR